jgi:Skp family chaperone for outer membrane proteins
MKKPEDTLKIFSQRCAGYSYTRDEMIAALEEHSSQFTSQIEELTKEVERLKAEKQRVLDLAKSNIKWHRNRNHELKLENDRYREALEYTKNYLTKGGFGRHDCLNKVSIALHPLVKEGE